jgi:hypothetical protein
MHAMNGDNSSDRWVAAILLDQFELNFSALADEFRNELGADHHIAVSVDRSVKEFKRHFRKILAFDEQHRKTALDAIISALQLSAAIAARPKILAGLIGVLHSAQTEPARAARKRDDIQEIVVRETEKLWKLKPSFKGNPGRTAKEIFEAVVTAIKALPKPPKGWEIAGLSDPEKQRKFIEAIRKRVARIK